MQTEALDQMVQWPHQVFGLQIDNEGDLRVGEHSLLEGGYPDPPAPEDAAIDAHVPVPGVQTRELVERERG